MHRHVLRLTTVFDASAPARSNPRGSRSPLSPISAPNELIPRKKSFESRRYMHMAVTYKGGQRQTDRIPVPSHPPRRTSNKLGSSRHATPPMSAESSRSTRRVFKWVKGETIGRGTHGRVYLGLDATNGEMLAVKQVTFSTPSESRSGRPSPRTLKLEMENMKKLNHVNLVEYLGLEEEGCTISIFMEYVPGDSIRENVLKHGALNDELVKSFTAQILDGLAYLHSRRIMHGDLKSSNVLLYPDGRCKIEGLCCSSTTLRDNSMAVPRSIFWTAPEVVSTQYRAYTEMADVWSLGCVVLEMCSGTRPWSGVEAVAVLYKLYQQTGRPEPPADCELHPGARDLMDQCLALNPDERTTAADLRLHPYLVLPSGWSFTGF
ncbi:kinase-like protein [Roridomyces roridus]|uniref:Kinase-like protein n=1 Tax=Roridomyces roridus TaxID=1738132 RepID=A0AAD7CIB0_9AGAR|nr:kinase-like protein [Roridomyces roridus]